MLSKTGITVSCPLIAGNNSKLPLAFKESLCHLNHLIQEAGIVIELPKPRMVSKSNIEFDYTCDLTIQLMKSKAPSLKILILRANGKHHLASQKLVAFGLSTESRTMGNLPL